MALGGRKATRGRRDIHVDGTEYYWRLVNDDRKSMRAGKLGVIIGRSDKPHLRVAVNGSGLASTLFVVGRPVSHSKVTPALVRQAILFARSSGWPDRAPSLAMQCDRNGKLSVADGSGSS